MIELRGKYGIANVFTDNIDEKAIAQLIELCNQEFTKGSTIAVMPDVHAGKGCTIGTTMTIHGRVVPNLVGVDIGCGIWAENFHCDHINLSELDKFIRDNIPSGFDIHNKSEKYAEMVVSHLRCGDKIKTDRALKSMGTLGGGNHFIEVGINDSEGLYLLTVHTGSRNLGLEVCKYYQEEAWKQISEKQRINIDDKIAEYKKQGRQSEIPELIKKAKEERGQIIPKDLAYCEGKLYDDYLHDMNYVRMYANNNRLTIVRKIMSGLGYQAVYGFDTEHNYIDTLKGILRKGAIAAYEGTPVAIPMNMRDGILICEGKGNKWWNYSAPHGAGRIMSRGEAKRSVSIEDFKKSMDGIFSTSVGEETLDESPMVYKPASEIIKCIGDTVKICSIVRPIYNFKASSQEE